MASLRGDDLWPVPSHNYSGEEPQFFFIITPPYSGSTALSQILNTAPGAMTLAGRGEGQWLVPGLCGDDRWDPAKPINWESVRAVWLERIHLVRTLVGKVTIAIEKSPPNLVRMDQIVKVFPNNAMMAFTRNPYASCSSLLYRRYNPEKRTESQRIEVLEKLASDWVSRAIWIRKWTTEFNLMHITYEKFCQDPSAQVARIAQMVPAFQGVNVEEKIKVKDYRLQGIVDQNSRQIANLTVKDRAALSAVFSKQAELLSFFGYSSDWEKPIEEGGAGNAPSAST